MMSTVALCIYAMVFVQMNNHNNLLINIKTTQGGLPCVHRFYGVSIVIFISF